MTQPKKRTELNKNREEMAVLSTHEPTQNIAKISLLIAFFAFALSVTTPWIIEHYAPDPPPIKIEIKEGDEESLTKKVAKKLFTTIVEEATSIEIIEEGKEESETKEDHKSPEHWTRHLDLIIIMIALGGVAGGILGLVKSETRWIGGTAIFLGITAIIVQYMFIAFAILILIVLIFAILNSLGMEF